jgi:hypothetical protein
MGLACNRDYEVGNTSLLIDPSLYQLKKRNGHIEQPWLGTRSKLWLKYVVSSSNSAIAQVSKEIDASIPPEYTDDVISW